MFIETYCDERPACTANSSAPAIPYPELVGEELSLWQRYLPVQTELEKEPFWLEDNIPHIVREQLEKARKEPYLFEHIEIWSRSGDPMAVGLMGGEQPRYFSIARWGEARVTLEQVKKRLRVEEWVSWLIPVGFIAILLVAMITAIANPGQFPEWAQTTLYRGGF